PRGLAHCRGPLLGFRNHLAITIWIFGPFYGIIIPVNTLDPEGLVQGHELPARRGRPSRHPRTVRYCEAPSVNDAMQEAADRLNMTFAEVQRMVNRAGLQALNIMADA